MELFTLSNITAWSLQIALLTIAAAILPRVLKFDDPVIRYAYWRTVLALCLLLPFVQTWRLTPPEVAPLTMQAQQSLGSRADDPSAPRLASSSSLTDWTRTLATVSPNLIAGALALGVGLKCAWLLAGIVRLRRLRRIGTVTRIAGDGVYQEVSALVQARADVRRVPGLGQPVTFGLWSPTVLVPEAFEHLPDGVRRAALAHELWHVRRRDWAWLVAEELLRAAFWFHPAISWLVLQVQRSREEVVDELTVLLTNARRTYIETLLRFAEEPSVYPAASIASRGHLLQRMLLISKEAGMSRQRIMASSIVTMLVVVGTVGYGVSAFPLNAVAPAPAERQAKQAPPRDPRRESQRPETPRERELKQQLDRTTPSVYLNLSKLQELRGALAEAEATLLEAKTAFPTNPTVLLATGAYYMRTDQLDKSIEVFREGAKVSDALRAHYANALNQKAARLEMEAGIDTSKRAELVAAAEILRERAKGVMPAPPPPPPPPSGMNFRARQSVQDAPPQAPPPPAASLSAPAGMDGNAPVRVGGSIKAPKKIKDVKPAYPEEAQFARAQGVVIIEATIDANGRIAGARVLKSVPMLDEAALDAVKQWEFEPTMVNNVAVPVIMTVTVNFAMQP
jgi:TonB family protein